MGDFSFGFVLPVLLLIGSLLNWSLFSFIDLLAFLFIQYIGSRRGSHSQLRSLVLLVLLIFSAVTVLAEAMFHGVWLVMGKEWSLAYTWWAKLIGLVRLEPTESPGTLGYFLVIQLMVAAISFFEIHKNRLGYVVLEESHWWKNNLFVQSIGSHLRVTCCLLLPPVQLVVGISRPSWVSLPFFLCSCIGLVHWSLSSNFLGLFWWWRPLLLYSAFNIVMLYIFQLPIHLPKIVQMLFDFIGFYKATSSSEWVEILSGISLLLFYFMLSSAKEDLEEMDFIMSMQENSLSEQLLPSRHSFFIKQSRSGVRHTNVFLKGSIFRNFSINFFTYGFPVSLLALSFWSFNFASLCAFGLLAYVGYILYAFPSLFRLHRLNGLLLVFILLWAASTYVFNVAFTLLNRKLRKDMEIWETIGLWHYPIPGFFLLAQFCLGILVAMGNLVNNSVFLCLSDESVQFSSGDSTVEEKEETKVLIVATIAWGLRKCSRAITLLLLFLLAMKPGFIHSIYMIFFLVYILSHSVSRKVRQSLILLCEAHFALLYILKLNMIDKALKHSGSVVIEILSQLGLLDHVAAWDFFKIVVLLCFCAIQNHGFKMLFSFSAILQHTSHPPIGFSILKAGLSKSVLLSVYSPTATDNQFRSFSFSHEKWVATYLSAIGQKFLSTYRSYGTYIAFLTILLTVYLVVPNYISFGYLFFLQLWIIGRQLVEKTRRRLWLPLKAYAILVFVFIYSLSIFPSFQLWLSHIVNLYPQLGYDPTASLLKNVWESLAVLIVMQLYSYERRQSRYHDKSVSSYLHELSILGFLKRLLVWHSEKVLSVSVFYASISPISAFSFIYLLALIICSILPKASRIPSKFFLVYTGTLVTFEYLFQMWGRDAHMFPGQKHADLSVFLGLQVFSSGFWGIEAGLRGKVLVIVACTLQYNVFHWLERMPSSLKNSGEWEEPCHLFMSREHSLSSASDYSKEKHSSDSTPTSARHRASSSSSWPSFVSQRSHESESMHVDIGALDNQAKSYSYSSANGSSGDSHQWDKRSIQVLRKARFDMQMKTLRIFMKYWTENVFNLFGLEINMIALLLASFAVLNAISLFYILCLVACILLSRQLIHKLWPVFFFLFATILILEYFAVWKHVMPWNKVVPSKEEICCHDCWSKFNLNFDYCRSCWLGIVVDDPKMLISYYLVFIFASFKLRADHLANFCEPHAYPQMVPQRSNPLVWGDLSFEIKSEWSVLDYLKLYAYCHLLDVVLCLILVTGTLEYDILHLGYLGFALVFFRMRLEILKKKNKIFKFLRMYNFAVIVLSLAYQSPFFGGTVVEKCKTMDFIYEVVGFYKYDYGFRITSRSALVEIIIFILVSAQSYIFRLREFDYVSRYIEAEQIDAVWRGKTKKAAWRTAQLQHIRKLEEQKRQRNLQVEKMKAEMLNLQNQLDNMNSTGKYGTSCPELEGGQQKHSFVYHRKVPKTPSEEERVIKKQMQNRDCVSLSHSGNTSEPEIAEAKNNTPPEKDHMEDMDSLELPSSYLVGDSSFCEITEVEEKIGSLIDNSNSRDKKKANSKENPLISAVHLIGDGVSQVQSLGNQAVTNIVSFLNIEHDESDLNENAEDNEYGKMLSWSHSRVLRHERLDRTSSTLSSSARVQFSAQIGKIFQYVWTKMQANNDAVCYFFFILVFLWNFSLLSMVYLTALFLYALCVNPGPGHAFWVIMLIYTEVNILVQYLYQIIIQHCALNFHPELLSRLGFPAHRITSSFVVSTLPLFLVYISTLLQSSITAKDGEYASVSGCKSFGGRYLYQDEALPCYGLMEQLKHLALCVMNIMKIVIRSFSRYWRSLVHGSEAPPYFVQLSLKVDVPPEYEIQLDRIESGINKLLKAAHNERCDKKSFGTSHSYSHVRVQSIERSPENSDVVLAVFEVIYASPLTECPASEWHASLTPAADVASEILKAQAVGLVEESGFPYSIISVIAGGKREIDLYAYIFGADMATFFLVAVLYQSAIKNNSKFLDVYQLEDQFPKEFVFVLMVLFFLIVLDRIIYLCSFAMAKVIFYLTNLVLFTYSVTEYAWYLELAKQQAGGLALRAIYLTKAVSLVLQALQIRYGIPHKSALYQQFLTSRISHINYLGFRLYRALPFLYELRCVLDWSCTSTSLTMYDWLKLEDIYASLYLVKCDADLNRATHQQGQKQTKMTKFCSGICLFFILICVIWAPMLMYSSGNPSNIANPVKDASVQIDIRTTGGRLTLYRTTLCEMLPWEELRAAGFDLDRKGYLETYNVNDIQLICCQADASSVWSLPRMVQLKFMDSLDDMHIFFSWMLTRDRPKGKEVVQYRNPVEQPPDPSELKKILNGTADRVRINNVYPRYFRVTGSGEVRLFEEDVESVSGDLVLNHGSLQWWSFHDANASVMEEFCRGLKGPAVIIVSEETPQGILGETLSKFSIWSLYLTFVLAVGRFIRLQCSDLRMRIPYENLPTCDRLIAICENIYAARAEGELEVEEVLYWTLVKIYRSPHMLLEYTKCE